MEEKVETGFSNLGGSGTGTGTGTGFCVVIVDDTLSAAEVYE